MRNIIGKIVVLVLALGLLAWSYAKKSSGDEMDLPDSTVKLAVIVTDLPVEDERVGGVIAADVSGDGRRDFIITKPGHVAVYDNSGKKLWSKRIDIQVIGKAEDNGLPGWHGPGVQVADIDGDQAAEVLFLTRDGDLRVVMGSTGTEKWRAKPTVPKGAERWEHLVVADFRGKGDKDLLLQATNAHGYRMGRYLAAYALDDLQQGKLEPLWQRDDFLAYPTRITLPIILDEQEHLGSRLTTK